MFDVLCGTSTGGILALALAELKMRASDCVQLYLDLAHTVFAKKSIIDILMDKPMYNENGLENILTEKFKQSILQDSHLPKV